MNPKPLVSVVIPTYNRWPLIAEAVESVLRQEHQSVETIVVDDGSTDHTTERIEAAYPQVRVIRQSNAERGAARNRGVEAASGQYVSFLDADDMFEPWHVSQFAAHVDTHRTDAGEHAEICFSPVLSWEPDSGRLQKIPTPFVDRLGLPTATLLGAVLTLPGLFIPREAIESVGGFPEARSIARGEDWVFLARLASQYRVTLLPRPSTRLRHHPGRSINDTEATISARWASAKLLLEDGVAGKPLDEPSRRLVIGGSHRFCAACCYEAGMMQEARGELVRAVRILGLREGVPQVARLWAQTWLGSRGSRAAQRLRAVLRAG